MLEGGDRNAMLGVMKVLEANAASQQTLFIVSGSTSIHCYREVTQMLAVLWSGFGRWNNSILYSGFVETRIWLYFLSPCIQVHNLCSTVFPTHALCKTGEIRTTAKEVLLSCSPDVLRVRVATSQLGRNSLLRIGTFTCLWIEECQTDIHNNVLLNFPLLKLWEPVSTHNICNVPPWSRSEQWRPGGPYLQVL